MSIKPFLSVAFTAISYHLYENSEEITNWIKMTLTEKEDALIDIEERRKEFIKRKTLAPLHPHAEIESMCSVVYKYRLEGFWTWIIQKVFSTHTLLLSLSKNNVSLIRK